MVPRAVDYPVRSKSSNDCLNSMERPFLVWVFVEEAIDTTGTDGSCQYTLSLFAGPSTWFIAAAKGLSSTSNKCGFDRLLDSSAGVPRVRARTRV